MNARVGELLETLRKIEIELAEIRAKCPHPSYFVGMWSWRVGAFHPSRICNECKASIPGITDEESKKCHEEFYRTFPV